MQAIRIETGKAYDVLVENGGLFTLGERTLAACEGASRVLLVADDTVDALYGKTAETSLTSAGLAVSRFVFPHGEASKTVSTYLSLISRLAAERFTRSDILVALGGGVTGDLTGFAAATYLRGIRFVQVPTTVLAAVDSSVGGKTAVDLPEGKNLLGAFHQPSLVLLDPNTFDTLPKDTFADGIAEAIKTGIIGDPVLFSLLESGQAAPIAEVVARSIALKGRIVAEDEREGGLRQLLNLGHTVAHAVELLSGMTVTHGHAVAIGISVIAHASEKAGLCDASLPARIDRALQNNGLPTTCPYAAEALLDAMLSDKKRSGDALTLIIPRKIGVCERVKLPLGQLVPFLQKGLEG